MMKQEIFDEKVRIKRLNQYKDMRLSDPIYQRVQSILQCSYDDITTVYHRNFENVLTISDDRYSTFWQEYPQSSFDAIISCMHLHCINDIQQYLRHCSNLLQSNGVFLCSFLGNDTLSQLRKAFSIADYSVYGGLYPRIIPMIDAKTAAALLSSCGYQQVAASTEDVDVVYDDFHQMLRHIKTLGESNSMLQRKQSICGKMLFQEAEKALQGQYISTFSIVTISGFKPIAKPL